jgi:hypothetical protein
MPRLDTRLEAEAAEFLVLGQLLLNRITAHKTYTRMPGYDLVAMDAEHGRSAKIQVKSRWETGASGFLIKSFDSDFVVVVRLNRGRSGGGGVATAPEYFVFPTSMVRDVCRTKSWSKAYFTDIATISPECCTSFAAIGSLPGGRVVGRCALIRRGGRRPRHHRHDARRSLHDGEP